MKADEMTLESYIRSLMYGQHKMDAMSRYSDLGADEKKGVKSWSRT